MESPNRRWVLVAEDDAAIRNLLAYNLGRAGYEVEKATNGLEAMDRVREEIRVAVVDLRMPGADGWAVLRHFRTFHPSIPVVIVSANAPGEDIQALLRAGAFGFVCKPFRLEELLERIREAEASRTGAERGLGSGLESGTTVS